MIAIRADRILQVDGGGAASSMRIGTWNLAGRWDTRHAHLMRQQNCEVWLLTEVSESLALEEYTKHLSASSMAPRRRWAAILTRTALLPLPDPHAASALARVGDLHFCSSILPWRSCGSRLPWIGIGHAEKTKSALDELLPNLPQRGLVWGGDWNHALSGKEFSGSRGERSCLVKAISDLGLQVPTAALPHRLPQLLSIDHIAVPASARIISAGRIDGRAEGVALSDHDAYVVEVHLD